MLAATAMKLNLAEKAYNYSITNQKYQGEAVYMRAAYLLKIYIDSAKKII